MFEIPEQETNTTVLVGLDVTIESLLDAATVGVLGEFYRLLAGLPIQEGFWCGKRSVKEQPRHIVLERLGDFSGARKHNKTLVVANVSASADRHCGWTKSLCAFSSNCLVQTLR